MKISVITVCLNSAPTIEETIRSVIEQEDVDLEYIIIDGDSVDGTIEIVRSYIENVDYFVSEQDKGIYDAMNKGFFRATGDVICYLNADDRYANKFVLKSVKKAFERSQDPIVYGDVQFWENSNRLSRSWKVGKVESHNIAYRQIPHPAIFIRRTCLEALGLPFDARFKISADYRQQYLLIGKFGMSTNYIGENLVNMRLGGASTRNFRASIIGWKECLVSHREVFGTWGISHLFLKVIIKVPGWLSSKSFRS